ncbi:cyclin-T2-like [Mastacembelus armatus]|uniref:cyclin-T2-like n=1 Tax=Mastacembelus armatus TaxID=205130 RepID=UPI000E45D519|nr:cyclin-T2-like [Mastacembelus armatus]
MDSSFVGPSMLQGDTSLPGVSSNPGFPKAGAPFTVPMPGQSGGAPLSLDTVAGPYTPASHSEWPQANQSQSGYGSTCLKQEPLSIPHQEQTLSLQSSSSSLLQHPLVYRTEKTDFNLVKQEHKGAGGGGIGKHQPPPQSAFPPLGQPPPPQPSPAQKLSLDKYREKQAAELAVSGQKRRQEQHGGGPDCDMRGELSSSSSTYAPSSMSQVDHRKHSQHHQTSRGGGGGGSSSTASPMKIKVPSSSSSGQDRRHHSDKRDKGSLKVRLAVPGSSSSTQQDKSGQSSKDELKMKIKVSSSERHSSSDEGMSANNNKSTHSSPLVSKEKHRGAEHNLHRHHKHSHPHTHIHSGNGRGGTEGLGGGGGLPRGPPGLVIMEGATLAPPGSTSLSSTSSRKRAYPEGSYNHHPPSSASTSCSKVNKISKGGNGAAGTSSLSFPLSLPCSSPLLQCVSPGLQLFG